MAQERAEKSYSGYFHLALEITGSLIAQLVENPPAMQEALVQVLGEEDPLEKGEATHSRILGLWLSL